MIKIDIKVRLCRKPHRKEKFLIRNFHTLFSYYSCGFSFNKLDASIKRLRLELTFFKVFIYK